MHMITINNTMCGTGHLHASPLTCSEHRHHQNYKVNHKLHLAVASMKFVFQVIINLKMQIIQKIYSKMQCKIMVHYLNIYRERREYATATKEQMHARCKFMFLRTAYFSV